MLTSCGGAQDKPLPSADPSPSGQVADVVAIEVSGSSGAFTFAVSLESDETGCDRYADWWEVLSPEGALLYRRILGHSHPDEQPFTRSGGPVAVAAEDKVLVRGHMNPGGYGGLAMEGTVTDGFIAASLPADFAEELAGQAPLPDGCAF